MWKQISLLEGRMHRLIETISLKSGRPGLAEKLVMLERFVPVVDKEKINQHPAPVSGKAAQPALPAQTAAIAAVPVAPASGGRPAY